MKFCRFCGSVASALLLGSTLLLSGIVYAQSIQAETLEPGPPDFSETIVEPKAPLGTSAPEPPSFASLVDGATKIDGLIPLYRNGPHLYAALRPNDFDNDLIVLISIARGIAQKPLYAGATWNFGDDWVCQFRRAGQRVHFVRRNVRYRAQEGSPSACRLYTSFRNNLATTTSFGTGFAQAVLVVTNLPI